MSDPSDSSPIEAIGHQAGVVWRVLEAKGSLSVTNLIKAAGGNKDLVLQAIGWLAREDKIEIQERGRAKTICLR